MNLRNAVVLVILAGLAAAQAPPPSSAPSTGSISGVVKDAVTGAPLAKLPVRASASLVAETDAKGRYTLRNVPPGRRMVGAGSPPGASAIREVTLGPGQEVRSIDFNLQPNGTISGRVHDQNNEPMPGFEIVLLGRDYFTGAVHYYRRKVALTNDMGEYRIQNVRPGAAHLVLARQPNRSMKPISEVPLDPKLRRPATVPTYYPNSARPEGGELIVVRAGESREGVDIRVSRSLSYCVEGVLGAGSRSAELSFWIHEREMSFGLGPSGGATGLPPGGKAGPDGKIRICDLHPGEYKLTAFSGDVNNPLFFATTEFVISDRDVRNIALTPQPRFPLNGRVVWAGVPPNKPIGSQLIVMLSPLDRTAGGLGEVGRSSVPGEFSVKTARGEDLLMDEYTVSVRTLPGGLYVKDITYGNTSVLHGRLRSGSAIAGAELRVILGHDPGFVRARVADRDGNAAPDANIILMPKEAGSEPDLAAMRITGRTDQNGEYVSPALVPGQYHVLATRSAVTDWSPESIGKLWGARSKSGEIDVGPAIAVQLTLEPIALD